MVLSVGCQNGRLAFVGVFAQSKIVAILLADDLRKAPVHDVRLAKLADHDVRRLEVAMDHSLGVRVGHRLANAKHDAGSARHAPTLLPRPRDVEDRSQVASLDVAHREERAIVLIDTEIVDGNDARMLELTRDLRFFEKAAQKTRIGVSPAWSAAVP